MSDAVKVIRILGYVDGEPTEHAGRFIVEFDPDGDEEPKRTPLGFTLRTSADLAQAQRFTPREAFELIRAQSRTRPTRPWDGEPNLPLLIFNTEILDLDSAA
jgi:hypothetical protein